MTATDVPPRRHTYLGQLLQLLSDGDWHTCHEMQVAGGIRYGARVLELIRLGYRVEKRPGEYGRDYRLRSLERGKPKGKRVKWYLSEHGAEALTRGAFDQLPADDLIRLREALASFRDHRDDL